MIGKKDETGVTILYGDVPYGLLKKYSYLQPNKTGTRFLGWYRHAVRDVGLASITVFLYDTRDFCEIELLENSIRKLTWDKTSFCMFNCEPLEKFTIQLDSRMESSHLVFPERFREFEEVIMVLDIPGLYANESGPWNRTAIVILKPLQERLYIYPQDWFNQNDSIDFGYEWIAMAARDPKTGLIKGEGIKVDPFTLDETNRQRLKY